MRESVLQLYIAVILDLAAVTQHLLHDLVLIRTVLKFHRHLQQHEVNGGILDSVCFPCSLLHEQCAVRAVNLDIIGFLHRFIHLSRRAYASPHVLLNI